jgi:NO-binding membrane sensor protein with MHYT domain
LIQISAGRTVGSLLPCRQAPEETRMAKTIRLLLLGIATWALPFAAGMAMFPIIPPDTALFDTLMAVAMAFSAALFGTMHLSRSQTPSLDEGLLAGSIWMLISLALDVPFFVFGPEQMRMAPDAYMADIGLTYVMIPIITGALGHALKRQAG